MYRDPRTGARDGETDFVIIHPKYGLLVLEVKGGIIRYDGAAAQWYSNEHMIKDPYYNDLLPSLLVEAADRLNWRFDAVIVDEGQDFREEWELSLQCLLHDPDEGIMYIFYDDNQNLYHPGQRIPLAKAPFPLTRNCRNTQLIHAFTQKFYHADHPITAIGPQGRSVVIERYDTIDKLKPLLRHSLHYLIIDEKVPAENIVVLTPSANPRKVSDNVV